MRLADVPVAPAYLVCHDELDKGAMEVWPCATLAKAQEMARARQAYLDEMSIEGCHYKAYEKLPRRRVWKLRPMITE